jgi:hypothetical protein
MEDILMGDKFKRAITGYKPNEVNKIIELQNSEFEREYKENNNEFAAVITENEMLKRELENIKQQMSSHKAPREKLENILYTNYIEAASLVYEEEKKLERMIREKTSILEIQKNKSLEIKASINKLLSEVQEIIED